MSFCILKSVAIFSPMIHVGCCSEYLVLKHPFFSDRFLSADFKQLPLVLHFSNYCSCSSLSYLGVVLFSYISVSISMYVIGLGLLVIYKIVLVSLSK